MKGARGAEAERSRSPEDDQKSSGDDKKKQEDDQKSQNSRASGVAQTDARETGTPETSCVSLQKDKGACRGVGWGRVWVGGRWGVVVVVTVRCYEKCVCVSAWVCVWVCGGVV